MDFKPVWTLGYGPLLFFIGISLAVVWVGSIYESVKKLKKRSNGRSKIIPLMVSGLIIIILSVNFEIGAMYMSVR